MYKSMMCIFFFVAASLGAADVKASAESPLSGYVIVLAKDAIPAEATAARELSNFLGQITGVKIPVGSKSKNAGKTIYVGQSKKIAALLGNLDFSSLRSDEIILRNIPEGFVVSGARPRGTLYAAYTLLEDFFGVRFWTPEETLVPHNPHASLPDISIKYAPPFFSREFFSRDLRRDPVYAARRKVNGHFSKISDEYGGHFPIMDWCHTFSLFDTSKHPEWNSLHGGKRTENKVDRGQFCLSNQALRHAYLDFLRERLRKNPDTEILSVSQNDISCPCECKECTEMKSKNHWNETDMLLDFVNFIAAGLAEEFPKLKIETLAYKYTQAPPLKVRPNSNVIICLCTPMYSVKLLSSDSKFVKVFDGWSSKADSLYVWYYVSNFMGWLLPYPNLFVRDENLRFLRAHHAKVVFTQGDSQTLIGDFMPLRNWVETHLLWNPDLDTRKLIGDFCREYYGPASPLILEYLHNIHQEATRPEASLSIINCDGWLRTTTMLELIALMDKAISQVKGTELEKRVMAASLPIRYALLLSGITFSEEKLAEFGLTEGILKKHWEKICRITQLLGGESYYRENQKYQDLFRWLNRRYSPTAKDFPNSLPKRIEKVNRFHLLDMSAEDFICYSQKKATDLVSDSLTLSGKAVKLECVRAGWIIQLRLVNSTAMSWFKDAPFARIYLRARIARRGETPSNKPVLRMSVNPQGEWPSVTLAATLCLRRQRKIRTFTGFLGYQLSSQTQNQYQLHRKICFFVF